MARSKTEAGDYPDRMIRQIQSEVVSSTGDHVQHFTAGNSLWCRLEYQNSQREMDYGGEQTGARATIYVRGERTNINTLDRILHVKFNDIYIIDSIKRGDNELIMDCYKFDTLVLST